MRAALQRNAAAVILAHPHPSGVCEPSQADELITRPLIDALQLVDIRVLDHLIIAGGEVLSFAERDLSKVEGASAAFLLRLAGNGCLLH